MKYLFILVLAFAAVTAKAQSKKDTVAKPPDTAATNATLLLSYNDVIFMRDSLMQNAAYKYAPVIDAIFQYFTDVVQQRALIYNKQHAKYEPAAKP